MLPVEQCQGICPCLGCFFPHKYSILGKLIGRTERRDFHWTGEYGQWCWTSEALVLSAK